MFRLFGRNPFLLFYIVFGYIIIFSLWWGFLLFSKNEAAFTEKVELDRINFKTHPALIKYEESDSYLRLFEKYRRQRVMILGEGLTFLVLQILGLLQVRRVFAKEIELAAQQKNFMHSITHELKSPLSSVKLSLQTFQKRSLSHEQQVQLTNNAIGDVIRLESLVDNILFAAKIESDTHGFSNEKLNLSELVLMACRKFEGNKKGIEILTEVPDKVLYSTDLTGFTSVILNLVENAIKYSEQGAKVSVRLFDNPQEVVLSVADQGIGISDAEKTKIFEKFYRIGNEDTRKTKGTGLGLFIVKRFVEIYQGKVQVRDNNPMGSIFEIRLPK